MQNSETARASVPPSSSTQNVLLAALAAAAASVLLWQLGSGHTAASRRFADRPEFDVWTWTIAAEVGAAVAVGVATWPTFRVIGQATGRRAIIRGIISLLAAGLLIMFVPRAVTTSGDFPLWLHFARVTVATLVVGIFVSPSFLGLVLVQTRLHALAQEAPIEVAAERGGHVVVELLWLRAALQRFLVSFAVVISGAVLAAGALRNALLADGAPAENLPVVSILSYGGFFTVLSALIFVPAYLTWQEQVFDLRDQLYPVPRNGLQPHDWYQARSDFDVLLSARSSAGSRLATAFGILAPLAGGLVAALIPTS
jgi:hypothetical protein